MTDDEALEARGNYQHAGLLLHAYVTLALVWSSLIMAERGFYCMTMERLWKSCV